MNEKKVIKSCCKGCHGGCGVLITVEDGTVTYIEGDPDSITEGTVCTKGLASIQHIDNPNRVKYPIKRTGERGEGKWQRISWEEALDTIAGKMNDSIATYGANSVCIAQGTGRGANRYVNRLARSIGTGNVFHPGYLCHSPRLLIYGLSVTGYGRLYCDYHGWGGEYPKTQISWAKQLEISNADGEMSVWFLRALEKAKNLILVDPRVTALTQRATLWLRIRHGTDAALALGMMNIIINEGLYDREFVTNWCHGFPQLRERVQEYPPNRVAEICWIPKEDIIKAARIFATDTPGTIQIGEPLEAQNNSTQTIRAIICLMAITGNIERPGGMVCWEPPDVGIIEDFAYEVTIPEENQRTTIGAGSYRLCTARTCHADTVIKQLKENNCGIKVFHCQQGSPLNWLANTKEALPALLNLEFISVCDLFMSPTAEHADIVLPVAHWLEHNDIWNMHPRFYVAAINKAVEPPGEAWGDNKIVLELGKRVAPKYWWFKDVEEMLDYQLRKGKITWKEFSKMGVIAKTGEEQTYYKYKMDGWRKATKLPFMPERKMTGPGFPTPTGKVELYSTILEDMGYDPLPYFKEPNESPYSTPKLYREYPLILSTGGRLPYYFHSQYRQIPWLRELQPYPITQIHPDTAKKLGIKDGDWVWIETPRGRIKQKAKLFKGSDPRVVTAQASWFYPDQPGPLHGLLESNANVLTSNDGPFDPAMGAPTFRVLLCKVYKVEEDEND
jgi:anaerobic selenocysteine-containing dehydrogenase